LAIKLAVRQIKCLAPIYCNQNLVHVPA